MALAAVIFTAAGATAQSYDIEVDGLYLKLTSTATDTIEASLVGIKVPNEGDNIELSRVVYYRNNPIIITGLAMTEDFVSAIGDTLTVTFGVEISSLKNAPFRHYTLPKGVNWIYYIEGNPYIETANIPDDTLVIPDNAFFACSRLKKVCIPASVTEIGSLAFAFCEGLSTVEGMDNVARVGDRAFSGCNNLPAICFSDNLKELGEGAFRGCWHLKDVKIGQVKTIRPYTFDDTGLESLEFLNGVTTIEEGALTNLRHLDNAVLPASLTELSLGMLQGNVQSVKIGNGLKNLKRYAFTASHVISGQYWTEVASCLLPNLTQIDLNQVETLDEWAFMGFNAISTMSLPSSVKSAYANSFYFCRNVTVEDSPEPINFRRGGAEKGFSGDIYLGRSLTGDCYTTSWTNASPFGACNSVTFGDLVERLPGRTFAQVEPYELTLPKNIRFVGQNCFKGITNEVLVLPESLDTIGSNAFGSTPNLQSVKCLSSEAPVSANDAFPSMVYAFATLEVPDVEAYRAAPGWKNFRNIVTSGIDDPLADPSAPVISLEEGAIKVSGSGDAEIYTSDGRLVYRGSPATIPALPRGLYIVRAGSSALKLTL